MIRSFSESNFTLVIVHNLEEIKEGKNNVVLFGSVGNGKTYLLNKICGKNYLTSDEGYSCTRNVQYDYSLKNDMVIIDFPGLNAVQDIVGHLKVQKTALSAIPVRMICFVIKYSPRNDDFERELGQMLSIFDNYIKNIVIIITKSENIDMKRKEEIKFLFKNKFNIENVLFTTKKTNGYDLCEDLNRFKTKMENIQQILVKTRDLAKTVPSLYNKDMAKERENYEDKFYDALEAFKKEVENAKDPDLKRALYFGFKDFKDHLLEEYTNVIKNKKIDGKEPDMDSVVAEVLMFDNNVYNEFNDFRKQIESQIEVKSSNYNGEYNRFKKCPHCGIIWFKLKGCDSVQCGKRTKATDKIVGRYKKYTVNYINNKIVIHSEDLGNDTIMMNNQMMNQMNNPMMNQMGSMNNLMNNLMMIQMNNPMMNQMNSMNNQMSNSMNNQMNNPMMNQMGNHTMNPMRNPMNNQMSNSMNNQMNNPMMNQMSSMNNQMSNSMNNPLINMMNQMNLMMSQMNINQQDFNIIENEDEFTGLTKKEIIENKEREKNGKIKINPLGCGRNLDWKEMEDCSDEVIEKLKVISPDDYYSGFLKINDKIKK